MPYGVYYTFIIIIVNLLAPPQKKKLLPNQAGCPLICVPTQERGNEKQSEAHPPFSVTK